MKKITLKIEAKEYDINLQEDIAAEMEKIIHGDFRHPEDISLKELLSAYIKNTIDKHHLQQELDSIYSKINSLDL